jgi:hypothetical protein
MEMANYKSAGRRPVCLVLLFLLSLPVCASAAPGDKSIGIFPVFEQGDSKLGSAFAQHLTTMIYSQLQTAAIPAQLLNPGGLYSGSPDAETLDYARAANVTAVLVTTLLSTEIPEKGDFSVRVDGKLVDVASGSELASWESTAPISRHEFLTENAHTYGREAVSHMPGGTYGTSAIDIAELSGSGSHPFEKTAVGKAARKIAEDMGSQVAHSTPPGAAATAPVAVAPSCKVDFKVSYIAKHASSKSYDVVVNGKNETLSIVDGKVPLTLNSGPVLVQIAVHDAPYKMPKQDIYQANAQLACAPEQHTLVFQIDQVGEGTLKWQE